MKTRTHQANRDPGQTALIPFQEAVAQQKQLDIQIFPVYKAEHGTGIISLPTLFF